MTEGVKRDALLALEKRVAEAKGPDAFLDREIENVLGDTFHHIARRYTSSVDESLALVSRVLPGMFWVLAYGRLRETEPLAGFSIVPPNDPDNPIGEGEAETLPLAIIRALLRSLTKGAGG